MPADERLPRESCRSLFAVWRWPRWVWVPIVALLLAMYLLSAAPVWWLSLRLSWMTESEAPYHVYFVVWWPANLCIQNSKVLTQIYMWELATMGVIPDGYL